MPRIERLKRPLTDVDPIPVDYLPGEYASVEAAEAAIEKLVSTYNQSGFDPKQGYWWARNPGDTENNIFVVR